MLLGSLNRGGMKELVSPCLSFPNPFFFFSFVLFFSESCNLWSNNEEKLKVPFSFQFRSIFYVEASDFCSLNPEKVLETLEQRKSFNEMYCSREYLLFIFRKKRYVELSGWIYNGSNSKWRMNSNSTIWTTFFWIVACQLCITSSFLSSFL